MGGGVFKIVSLAASPGSRHAARHSWSASRDATSLFTSARRVARLALIGVTWPRQRQTLPTHFDEETRRVRPGRCLGEFSTLRRIAPIVEQLARSTPGAPLANERRRDPTSRDRFHVRGIPTLVSSRRPACRHDRRRRSRENRQRTRAPSRMSRALEAAQPAAVRSRHRAGPPGDAAPTPRAAFAAAAHRRLLSGGQLAYHHVGTGRASATDHGAD